MLQDKKTNIDIQKTKQNKVHTFHTPIKTDKRSLTTWTLTSTSKCYEPESQLSLLWQIKEDNSYRPLQEGVK